MKKLYTLLAATAVALSASAAAPSSLLANYKAPVRNLSEVQTFKAEKPMMLESPSNKALKTPAMKAAPSANLFENLYWEKSYIATQNGGWTSGEMIYFLKGEGNTVAMVNFFVEGLQLTGTYDEVAGTISIPAYNQKFNLQFEDGSTAEAYFCLVDVTKKPYALLDEDIVLHFDKQTSSIYYDGEDDGQYYTKVIGFVLGGQISTFIAAIQASPVNSIMSWDYPIFDETGQNVTGSGTSEAGCWTEVNGNKMTVTNMLGAGASALPVEFTIDAASKKATATDALIGRASDETQTIDFYVMSADQSTVSTNVVLDMNVVEEDGQFVTVFTSANILGISDKTWAYYISESNYMCLNFEFYVNGDLLSAAGVEGVTVADENAPVEYYNLQGVKVANPESGLYIRRQGNIATKVLIK